VDEDIGGNGTPPGFAAVAHELAAEYDERAGVQVNGKRKRPAGAAEGTGDQQVTGGDHQEPLEPADGTTPPSPCPLPRATHDPTWILSLARHPRCHVAGAAAPPSVAEALVSSAQRILAFPGGNYTPSPPPPLLTQLTDFDLIVARDAVWQAAAAAEPKPSGSARYRLLAWVVADARGAAQPLAPPTALKVGKRLEAQALKTRGDYGAQRSCARHEAAADASLAAGLPAVLAAVDEAERLAMQAARLEVYVGFHELEVAAPAATAPEPAEPQLSRVERAKLVVQAAHEAKMEAATQQQLAELPDIPLALAGALGPDGVQVLWDHAVDTFVDSTHADVYVWTEALPSLVRKLLADAANAMHDHERELEKAQMGAGDLAYAQEKAERASKKMIEYADEVDAMEETHATEIARLQGELREAKGREEALQGVIAQWMHAQGVQSVDRGRAEP
jgi:hypothetical protein